MLFAHFAFLVSFLVFGGLGVATQTPPCLVSAIRYNCDSEIAALVWSPANPV